MSKEMVKSLIDLVPDSDMDTLYRVISKFIPEGKPELDEIQAIWEAKVDESPVVSHDEINWD